MRSLVPDERYFRFLDDLRASRGADIMAATRELACEFPNLRREEARAVFSDWRLTYRERHPVAERAFHV